MGLLEPVEWGMMRWLEERLSGMLMMVVVFQQAGIGLSQGLEGA